MPDPIQKRKRPPTFQHFPAKRAKKLKKAWVEKAKIKSKWKAQKRREGIVSLRSGVLSPEDAEDDIGTADANDKGSDYLGDSEPVAGDSHADSSSDNEEVETNDSLSNTAAVDAAYSPPSPPPHHSNAPPPPNKKYNQDNNKNRSIPHDKNKRAKGGANANKEQDQPSLRDLFRKAYSKDTLHTYKSGPLKKRGEQHGRGRGRGRGGRGGDAASTMGRGQPNMKLRMNAMLEKIKRDYS